MKKIFHTPKGIIEREVTQEELIQLAQMGDKEAKKELAKQELKKALTSDKKLNVIIKYLNLK